MEREQVTEDEKRKWLLHLSDALRQSEKEDERRDSERAYHIAKYGSKAALNSYYVKFDPYYDTFQFEW